MRGSCKMALEIEKKYLITTIPKAITFESEKEIHQTYLATGEEELRIRKNIKNGKETHTLTIKKGSGLSREELETEISLSTYNQLLSTTTKKPLIKTRKVTKVVYNECEYIVEIDIYKNIEDLIVVEVEFEKPIWFGEDVTEDKSYKNQKLWKKIQ
jgi:adenylate cyclase